MALIWKLRLTDGSTATAFAAEEFKRLTKHAYSLIRTAYRQSRVL